MDNEIKQVLDLILNKLSNLEKGQASLEKGQANLETGQANLEKGQANLEKGQVNLEKRQANLETGQANLEKELRGLKRRQDEIFQVVKAIEHSNTTRKAELDNLTHKVAHIEGTMSAIGEILQRKRA